MRSARAVFGTTAVPRCTPQLSAVCAGVALCAATTRSKSGSLKNRGLVEPTCRELEVRIVNLIFVMQLDSPKGEYAVSKIPFASQYALSSVSGRHGCSCTWLVTGTTLQCGRRISRFLIEKLDMPILLTFP